MAVPGYAALATVEDVQQRLSYRIMKALHVTVCSLTYQRQSGCFADRAVKHKPEHVETPGVHEV
jgi:hypothetical protein